MPSEVCRLTTHPSGGTLIGSASSRRIGWQLVVLGNRRRAAARNPTQKPTGSGPKLVRPTPPQQVDHPPRVPATDTCTAPDPSPGSPEEAVAGLQSRPR